MCEVLSVYAELCFIAAQLSVEEDTVLAPRRRRIMQVRTVKMVKWYSSS